MIIYKILIIDDSIENLLTMVSIIEKYHPESIIYQANSAKTALKILEDNSPDIILTDWEMPEMNGLELIKEIKSNPLTEYIPCIMVSGILMTPEHLKLAIDSGAVDYIRKPIIPAELLARLNSALNIAERHKTLIKEKDLKMIENLAFSNEFNRFFEKLQARLKKIEKKTDENIAIEIDQINRDIKEQIKNKGWKKHANAYQKLHPIFLKKLLKNHPQLTSTEVELCQMTRLGLNNKEISDLMFVTLGSLRVSKSRLRKKIGIPTSQNLRLYLISL
ncbi:MULTISPECIES: response regulator [unclassified Lentimicrobium]|uniref:response regulator n=1 Tax=unclassified Lentimicrobium TaxID=2677434 RepID=UPI001557F504|nr:MULTISPECIES: response regulator [unclassified Lentimicrobium]NPD44954.1 response regulator [Lentimicrobium sp. S6]NPD86921.1 response regulator [Lentimicrobium sp. L6]